MGVQLSPFGALVQVSSRNRLYSYKPYPKQREFHAAGAVFRERCLFACTQGGKTYSAAHEEAMHLTGDYPDWWKGLRFGRPIVAWCGSESNETSREIIQSALLGTEEADMKAPDFGTGAIPHDRIIKISKRLAGVTDVIDQIIVRHKSGRNSRVILKTYEQEVKKWRGKKVDLVWFDEEPPMDIYSEGLARIQAAKGKDEQSDGRLMMTFTPMAGATDVVNQYLQPQEGDAPRFHATMTIQDAQHYTPEERVAIIAGYPPHERKTRSLGVPMMGAGMVWPVDEDELKISPIKIPDHWARINGIDFGIDHYFGLACLAWDRDQDIVYLTDCWKKRDALPPTHSAAIKARGEWIPVAWPHDGINRDKDSGIQLHKSYRKQGVTMLSISARYEDDVGGKQAVEPIAMEMHERMLEGRFRVFSHLDLFFEEMRIFHRKDGKIVAANDDIIKATMYAMMMLRYASPKMKARRRNTGKLVGLRQWA